jgi:predicted branched-subunit amino acid permease
MLRVDTKELVLIFCLVETLRFIMWIVYLSWLLFNFPLAGAYGGEMLLMQHMIGLILAFPYNFLLAVFESLNSQTFFTVALTYFLLWLLFTLVILWTTRRYWNQVTRQGTSGK